MENDKINIIEAIMDEMAVLERHTINAFNHCRETVELMRKRELARLDDDLCRMEEEERQRNLKPQIKEVV